jgi:hypothetical protein
VIDAPSAEPERTRPSAATSVAAITGAQHGELDTLLHALTYARGGKWSLFERVASQFGEEPWFASECARTLSALGHIDLNVDLTTGRPREWAVAAPALVNARDGAIACGARSETMITRLQADAAAVGSDVRVIANDNAPDTVVVGTTDDSDITDIGSSLASAIGEDVRLTLTGAAALVAALPLLHAVAEALPLCSWPNVALERFDLESNAWTQTGSLDRPGAYKFMTRPLRYAVVRASGTIVCADNRVAKWVAALDARYSLLAYDETTETLTTRLGAQLPGLYERAAVLCSGRPPKPRVHGTVTYDGVNWEVAAALYDLLTAQPS